MDSFAAEVLFAWTRWSGGPASTNASKPLD